MRPSLVTIFLLIFFVSGCEQKPVITPSGSKIKLGIIAPLSGLQQNRGKEGLVGIKTAMQIHPYLNNGDKVELVIEDGQNDKTKSVDALKKLAQDDKVTAILAFSSSEPALEIARVAHRYKTPILAVNATNPDITKDKVWVSQLIYDDNFQGTVAALYVRDELLFDEVAVFSNSEDPYSSHLASVFVREFVAVGGKITDNIPLAKENSDFEKIIETIHKHKPDLIYLPVRSEDVISIAKVLRSHTWQPILMGSDGLFSNIQAKHPEEMTLLEGMLASDMYSYDLSLTEYGKLAEKTFYSMNSKHIPNSHSILGLEAFALMTDVMNRCNNPRETSCVNQMIRSTNNFMGIAGKISIDPKGKAQRPLYINRIEKGELKFVVKVN